MSTFRLTFKKPWQDFCKQFYARHQEIFRFSKSTNTIVTFIQNNFLRTRVNKRWKWLKLKRYRPTSKVCTGTVICNDECPRNSLLRWPNVALRSWDFRLLVAVGNLVSNFLLVALKMDDCAQILGRFSGLVLASVDDLANFPMPKSTFSEAIMKVQLAISCDKFL